MGNMGQEYRECVEEKRAARPARHRFYAVYCQLIGSEPESSFCHEYMFIVTAARWYSLHSQRAHEKARELPKVRLDQELLAYNAGDAPCQEEYFMSNKIVYPRSSARPIYLTVALLGLLGLAGGIVMLIAMADVPKPSYYLLIAAFGLLLVALTGALAVLLATNTRRPWGIDPNFGPPPAAFNTAEVDPYGATTDDLLRNVVQLPDGRGYGRRQRDDPEVVRRLNAAPTQEERALPPPPSRPAWVDEMLPPDYRDEPPAEPGDKPSEEPAKSATARFTEVPLDQLDQLDLLPAAEPGTNEQQHRQPRDDT
jgi:hypothetical protein